ncbi:hypothetical protein EUX98_g934 [Antrodiella citrinella]|uniref:NUDE domain-containing protein n=1 Tax=Antrodiella citrinella TaxID=2447956 RepID=A0A4S4N2T8_9APHY|nr:hypothetical protein EUX98_g934 [Antrodiella citrinella]
MWSKLSNALKRPGTPVLEDDDENTSPVQANVMSSLYEQHPNMSVFHQEPEQQDVPFPSPSPPTSPSKRRGLLKRMSKNPFNEADMQTSTPITGPSRLNMASLNMKKVKSSLNSISTDSARLSQDDTVGRGSLESNRPPATPITPHEGRFGSLRSILKPNHTPGTGASVRFFSRDAYKTLSPDNSNNSNTSEQDPSIFNRLTKAAHTRPSALEVFSPPLQDAHQAQPPSPVSPMGTGSLIMPLPPPDMTNIFDLSEEKDLPSIPAVGLHAPILDSAVEISTDGEELNNSIDHSSILANESPMRAGTPVRGSSTPPGMHDRSQSFSFGQTVFYSMGAAESSTPAHDGGSKHSSTSSSKSSSFAKNRSRAMSDTVFHSMIHSPMTALVDTKRPELDINDVSALVVMGSPEKEKDPFGAHAKTYYVPGTVLPPSPPQSTHNRKASREEDLIWSLRTQLALKSELCAQFETELNVKDDVVREWQTRAVDAEKDSDRRRLASRNYRKKFAELEKYIRSLEEEVERSRESSMDRSVMDEASSEALRMLHRRIGELEREGSERERMQKEVSEELEAKRNELESIKSELMKKNENEMELREGIKAAKDEMEQMGAQRQSLIPTEEQQAEIRAQGHTAAAATWELEKVKMLTENEFLHKEQVALQAQLTDAREEIVAKEEETVVLRAELEAQWKHTEKSGEDVEKLVQERDELKSEVEALNSRMSGMEMDWNENENKKIVLEGEIQELWAAKDEVDREREELETQLRVEQDHAAELTQALQEREDRVSVLTQERQYAQDTLTRVQENLRQRDAEIADYAKRFRERDEEVERIRDEMLKSKRDHSRIVDEQSRTLSEVVAREVESRAHMESVVREKAESDVLMGTLKERVTALKEEVERLRRQVHELQQESADKEVKLAQVVKQRAQDKEDLQGLNIALDSKQQELELLKRRVSVPPARGSAANTPATANKTSAPSARRESSIFGTPIITSRPPSVLSDNGSTTKETRRKLSDPPSAGVVAAAKTALGRSARVNAPTTTTAASRRVEGSMGPPPMKRTSSLAQSTSSNGSATPTRTPSGSAPSARAPSVTPTARKTGATADQSSRLRTSIASRESLRTVSSISEQNEKENVKTTTSSKPTPLPSPPTAKPVRRMSSLIG